MTEESNIPKEERITLQIEDVVYRGKGLARHDGCVVFVPGVLPGEEVRAKITKKKKKYAEAMLLRVVTPSDKRIEPICEMAGWCQGCAYQHIEYGEELRIKEKQYKDMLTRKNGVDEAVFLPAVGSPEPLGYRNKIVFHAQRAHDTGKFSFGYYGKDNKTIIDVPNCSLATKEINSLIKGTRKDENFTKRLKNGYFATFRYTKKDGAICWAGKPEPGANKLTEETYFGKISVHRRSFYQVNTGIADLITENIEEILKEKKPEIVVDLFCGVGVFAIAAGRAGVPAVMGIDSDRAAIRSAIQNAKRNKMKQVEFMPSYAAEGLRSALEPIDVSKCTLLIDPPRRGLENDIIDVIFEKAPARIIYVSCAADTLSRDITCFENMGFAVTSAQVFDMFPRTAHFESVTVLEKK